MMTIIKNQIEKIEECIGDFKASDYFSIDYKEPKKFTFTMACALAGFCLVGFGLSKVTNLVKNELSKNK